MNDQERTKAKSGGLTALFRGQTWALTAVGLSMLICSAVALLHFQQRRFLRQMVEALIEMKDTRVDLVKGFLMASLPADGTSPLTRDQGLALVVQSATEVEQLAQVGDFTPRNQGVASALAEYKKGVADFKAKLKALPHGTMQDAVAEKNLRASFYDLERLASRLDHTYESHLLDLAERLNVAFLILLGIAVLLLGGLCALLGYLNRRHRAATAARHENESRLRALIDNCPDWVWLKDAESRYITVNKAFAKELSRSALEIAGQTDANLWPPETAHTFNSTDQTVLVSGEPMRFVRCVPDALGAARWFETMKAPVIDADGRRLGTVGISRDITERTEAENLAAGHKRVLEMIAGGEQLKVTLDALLRGIEGQHPEMLCSILMLDADGIHLRHSAAPSLPQDYISAIDGAAIGAAAGSCGTAAFRKEPVQVADIASDPLWSQYKDIALQHGLKACWSIPILDSNRRVLATFACYFRNAQLPAPRHIRSIETAISTATICIRRHLAETALRESEERLRQAQKMEAIGHLSGGIAHDFNNILTIIQGNASLVLSGAPNPLDSTEAIRQIIRAAERAASLTRQLLMFSRKQMIQLTEVDLNAAIADTAKMLSRILGDPIALRTELAARLPAVLADAGMVEQVLMNLAVNSRDAMPNGGELSIATEIVTVTDSRKIGNPEASPGKFVAIRVSDTGCGIPADVLPHIFEPFFTTKEVGKGTGLGLSSAYGIVSQHRGWIEVESEPGRGTTFRIYFPAYRQAAPRVVEPVPPAVDQAPSTGTETLLIVEDDPAVRNLVCTLLKHLGYVTLEATSGTAALEVWKDRRNDIDLLLTDMMMPEGLSGWELAERLKADRPGLRIVYTSGYSSDLVSKGYSLVDGINFLHKPYPLNKLSSTIRKCLDSKPAMAEARQAATK